jgi:glycogen operon protein
LTDTHADSAESGHGTRPGSRFPPGATVLADGVNFCVFSRHATAVTLLLYDEGDSEAPSRVIELSPDINRTFAFWHVFVEGLGPGTAYTWRVDGPDDAAAGRVFNRRKELVDPWARAVIDARWQRQRAADPGDDSHSTVRGLLSPEASRSQLGTGLRDLEGAVIYEVHPAGFTRHPASGVRHPGTFTGLGEKVSYLRDLGITHVELLPVMAFDEQDVPPAAVARGLRNYWGYSTHSYYSPHPGYCVDPVSAAREFRNMVDAFHRAGIGVLLDVVFNHTAEGGATGPVINFKGLGNDVFYHLDPADRRRYRDYTGCGNTVNCNHPLVCSFIVRCLEYWVEHLGVDGFRFDLASVFARGTNGEIMADPLVPWLIEASPVLARVPLIAEAWDAAGLYHVGAFPGMAWTEWNGRFRDTMRRFVRGDAGMVGDVASRIAGSADLYADDGRLPCNSVNFVTCHDGFTLRDLVSYHAKRNEANGEDNRDGSNDNLSWNCGAEGETESPGVNTLRRRQAKNHMALLMLSRGVPMILAGDEVLRTQGGNNNAYCQDNTVSWFDWTLPARQGDMYRFTRELIAFRKRHRSLTLNRFFTGAPAGGRQVPDIAWHGRRLDVAPWHDPSSRLLRITLAGVEPLEPDLHVVLNMADEAFEADLPEIAGRHWQLAIDTARPSPGDILEPDQQLAMDSNVCRVAARSVAVVEGWPRG